MPDVARVFEERFEPLLGDSVRWGAFRYLVADLLGREVPVIVETGTLREPGNWKGDGQSSRIWDWVLGEKKGYGVSVDADLHACALASRELRRVQVVCQDSAAFLRGFFPFKITLLYLDSADDPWIQLAELSAAWDKLPEGCLIACDDAATKAVLVRKVLGEPVFEDYVAIWRK